MYEAPLVNSTFLDRRRECLYNQHLLEWFTEMAFSLETPLRGGELRGGPGFTMLKEID